MNEHMILNDELRINGSSPIKDGLNGLIGQVKIFAYDEHGNLLYVKRDHNKIIMPGSLFVLEQMFKPATRDSSLSKNIPTTLSTAIPGAGTVILTDAWGTPSGGFGSEKVFGFMVGNGGANATGVISPEYNSTTMLDSEGSNSFLPFRVVETPLTGNTGYVYNATSGGYTFYYIKGFDTGHEPAIAISSDNKSCYATMRFSISNAEFKEYFTLSGGSASVINQIGLVAGFENSTKSKWDDIRLITTINFSSIDVIGAASYTIEYTVYSK